MLAPTWKFMGFFFSFHLNFKLWIWMSLKFKTLYSFNSIFSYFLEILSFNKRPKGPIAHLRNISHPETVWAELWIFQQIHSKKYIIALPTSHSWEKNGSLQFIIHFPWRRLLLSLVGIANVVLEKNFKWCYSIFTILILYSLEIKCCSSFSMSYMYYRRLYDYFPWKRG